MKMLAWSSGTKAVAEGRDLASVARGLTNAELVFWIDLFNKRPLFHEGRTLKAEALRRGPDLLAGPLWRY